MADHSSPKPWLDVGRNDMQAVEQLITHHPIMLEIVCYHCQQASEKFLKAYLLAQTGEQPPRTHELGSLCADCAELDLSFNEIARECVRLNPYGVIVRYPNEISVEDADMRCAVRDMNAIVAFVEQRIEQKQRHEPTMTL